MFVLHVGFVSWTWNMYVGGGLMVLLGFGKKPESTPPCILTQGLRNVDWVTVWFIDMKVNSTMSPGAAMTELGLKTSPASPPTMT